MNRNQSLLVAIGIIGSGAKLAKLLGVSRAAISCAVCGRMPVPKSWCPVIELETKGQVKCEDLLPGIDWSILEICLRPKKHIRKEEIVSPNPSYISIATTAKRLNKSIRTIWRWTNQKKAEGFPQPIKLSAGTTVLDFEELLRWEEKKKTNTLV